MAWQVGPLHDQSDLIGFYIIDATNQRPIIRFSYSSCDEATYAHGLVAKALENAEHVGVVPPPAADFPNQVFAGPSPGPERRP
jgi:hypothetical protein